MLPTEATPPQETFFERFRCFELVLLSMGAGSRHHKYDLASVCDFYIITIMPKKIDHDERRRDIARAAIAVIGEQGIECPFVLRVW